MIVATDTGVLGAITNPNPKSVVTHAIGLWAFRMRLAGHTFAIPAIADYEVRRELLRSGKIEGVTALDRFRQERTNIYLPLNDDALRRAAQLWADVRNEKLPTAVDAALDGDVILMAQLLEANFPGGAYILATNNLRHFQGRVPADLWQNIQP